MSAPRRLVCDRCRRPRIVCYCHAVPRLTTRTSVLLLQHPREQHVGIGTARMAHLALTGSQLRVGTDFSRDPEVQAALAGDAPAYLLFPSDDAIPAESLAGARALTLMVVDGTWAQARKLVRLNPAIAALPRIGFTPAQPSQYVIRAEPAEFCVSTIEALAAVLAILEPDGDDFGALLDPFRAMVERQVWFETEVRTNRHIRVGPFRQRQPRPSLASRLDADWSRLVCVQGEANGWPVRDRDRPPPETVHFVAARPATGELYEAVIAPRHPLAPQTPANLELSGERLLAGVTVEAWRDSWARFCRPDDIVVEWGRFHAQRFAADGVTMPEARMNLRNELIAAWKERPGLAEEYVLERALPVPPLALAGRGGRRLSAVVALLHAAHG